MHGSIQVAPWAELHEQDASSLCGRAGSGLGFAEGCNQEVRAVGKTCTARSLTGERGVGRGTKCLQRPASYCTQSPLPGLARLKC